MLPSPTNPVFMVCSPPEFRFWLDRIGTRPALARIFACINCTKLQPQMNTDGYGSVFICTTNAQILVRQSRIFSPRRARRKAISKTSRSSRLRGGFFWLRLGCTVFICGFVHSFGCGYAALCDSWPRFLGLGFGAVTGDLIQVA